MRKILTLTCTAAALALSAVAPVAASETLGTILFGHPMEPGFAIIKIPVSDHDDKRAANYSNPSAETRARAQAEIASNPGIRATLERRNIQPHNVLAIQTALDGGKIIYAR